MKGWLGEYDPELSPKARHNLLRGDGSVFTRLYEDAAKQRYSPQSTAPFVKASHMRRSSTEQMSHINSLMAKHWKAVDKVDKERMKLEEEQMRELKDRPAISLISEELAEKRLHKNIEEHAKAELTAARHRKTQSEALTFEVVRDPRPVSLGLFEAARVSQQLVHTFVARKPDMASTPTCKVNVATGQGSPLRLPPNDARQELYGKVADLRNIRQLLAKSYNFDPIEPPDPLEMDFMERGKYWLEKKHSKLKEKADKIKSQELNQCTFKPDISRLKSSTISISSTNSTLNSPRYADIHIQRNASTPRLSLKKELLLESTIKSQLSESSSARRSLKPNDKLRVYPSLSPVTFKCAYKSGFDVNRFKKLAKKAKKGGISLRLK